MTASEVIQRFTKVRKVGRGHWKALCPSHGDSQPSLSIREGKKGVMIRCWSQGCALEDICKAVGLTVEELFFDSGRKVDARAWQAAQRKRKAEEAKAYRIRIREWIRFFRENGYTAEQYDDDVTVACAAAVMLSGGEKPHLHELLRVSMERITAASIGGFTCSH